MNRNTYHTKRLGPADVEPLRALNAVFATAFEDPDKHLRHPPDDAYLKRLLNQPQFIALVALSGDKVIGGIVAYQLEKIERAVSEVYLYDLAVEEAWRRRGVARQLVESLRAVARDVGASVIFVQADREDEPAIAFYRSLGDGAGQPLGAEEPFHFDIMPAPEAVPGRSRSVTDD